MPKRLCLDPECPNPARPGSNKCDEHARSYERERSRARRDTSHKSFYDTKRWRLTARRKKFDNPICEDCGEALSEEVHHDPPLGVLLAEGRNPYDQAVLVALCKPCHSAATLRERRNG